MYPLPLFLPKILILLSLGWYLLRKILIINGLGVKILKVNSLLV